MNIYWLVFQDLVELVERSGMHELVYEYLTDIVEAETKKGNLPEDARDLLSKIRRTANI